MKIKTLAAGAAIALFATIGSASAQEHFAAAYGTAFARSDASAGISAGSLESSGLSVTSGRHWQRYNRKTGELQMIKTPHGQTSGDGIVCVGGAAPLTVATERDLLRPGIEAICNGN